MNDYTCKASIVWAIAHHFLHFTFYLMSSLFELGIINYTHPVIVIVSVSPSFLEYIEFVMGMHLQGHWGDVSLAASALSDFGLLAGTSVSSAYDLVEEFQQFADGLIITTDIALGITIVSLST
jgi:hypothetical protein